MKPDQITEAATLRQMAENRLQSRISSTAAPLSMDETERLIHEIRVQQIELERQNEELLEAQTFLLRCGLPETGEDFFASLARYLSKSLEMEYVCIKHLVGDCLTAQTFAVFNNGIFETNARYALKDTPCGETANNSVCCYPQGVQLLFPQNAVLQELEAESYYGVTLFDSKGQPIGLIAIIGRRALDSPKRPERLLKLVAPRASAEFERRLAEEERDRLQLQLSQAQKMESVGRLAGGVAHDFNNMLTVIMAHAEYALMKMTPEHPFFGDMQQIKKAAERSAALTRQLLAFARKQTITPTILDLNATVEEMLKMLRRLIGEDINLVWQPAANLWPVRMDPSQIDQILANLCVNARDAIGGIGKLTIETGNTTFDEQQCANHHGLTPGDYTSLVVSDTGSGMDKETQASIFEPFFTTKDIGRGTGLGLASVYGIVKQNGGYISMQSEPGSGTTFKIYLPRHQGESEQIKLKNTVQPSATGNETILLVEDEPSVLEITKLMLEDIGYKVFGALTTDEAIRLAEAHAGKIDLLLTDVIMPDMTGRDLTRYLISLYPNLKQLFMSGYTADIIASQGHLDAGVNFIQKPFSISALAGKLREALDR